MQFVSALAAPIKLKTASQFVPSSRAATATARQRQRDSPPLSPPSLLSPPSPSPSPSLLSLTCPAPPHARGETHRANAALATRRGRDVNNAARRSTACHDQDPFSPKIGFLQSGAVSYFRALLLLAPPRWFPLTRLSCSASSLPASVVLVRVRRRRRRCRCRHRHRRRLATVSFPRGPRAVRRPSFMRSYDDARSAASRGGGQHAFPAQRARSRGSQLPNSSLTLAPLPADPSFLPSPPSRPPSSQSTSCRR